MDIEKLRLELVYLETMITLIPTASSDPEDKIARGIYKCLIEDTRRSLESLGALVPDAAVR
ncbi:MAG TPA: hypothetical protein VGE00_09835 [Gammaproteobacteria bacterium]